MEKVMEKYVVRCVGIRGLCELAYEGSPLST